MAKNPILKLLRDKRQLLEKLTQEVRVLEQAAMIYEAEPDQRGDSDRGPGRPKGSLGIQVHSAVGKAIKLLQLAGGPMHIDEIVRSLSDADVPVKKMSLVSSLSKLAKTDRLVRRDRPGTFVAVAEIRDIVNDDAQPEATEEGPIEVKSVH